ncbi:histidine kinase [Euzebyella marina]|uniref:Histidine kinase n=1 Tax=Euzebyella marina TaxID=1761453 RepID=A0A3G2L672_9FLAO|nr:2TM domain-containing protein [Euzebyella marina]AYN67759.1 histidine kinase [Euzebyella marina]
MEDFEKESRYMRAKERVDHIKKFYASLTSYIIVISFLAGLNYYLDQWSYAWFLWPALGWGIGLVFQWLKTYDVNPFFGRNWEERKIKEFMQEDEQIKKWE